MGWIIVAHGFALLFRNLRVALQVAAGPSLLAVVAVWLVIRFTGASPAVMLDGIEAGAVPPEAAMAVLLILLIFMLSAAWIAVGWHRFILLRERPSLLPMTPGARVFAYAGRSALLAMLLGLVMFPVGAIAAQVLAILGLLGHPIAGLLVGFLVSTLLLWFWMRIALVLPATALGRDYSLSQGWNDGARLSAEIFQAAAIVSALSTVTERIVYLLPLPGVVGWATQLVVVFVTAFLGTSLLTTLYGHIVERRPLG